MGGEDMSQGQTRVVEFYEAENLALAALRAEGGTNHDYVEPSYARDFPLLSIRESGQATRVQLRSKTPHCDQPLEIGVQLRRLVTKHGRSRIVLNLAGLNTTSSALNAALALFAKSVREVDGRLAICCIGDTLAEIFRLIRIPHLLNDQTERSEAQVSRASLGGRSEIINSGSEGWCALPDSSSVLMHAAPTRILGNPMQPPPGSIDNADVLEYALSDQAFGVVADTEGDIVAYIHGLAICRYRGSQDVYRFSCDENWETVQDMVYTSIQQAKDQLPQQYRNAPIQWRTARISQQGVESAPP
jgi:anti-anti-sigma regulatory factor